MVSQFDTDRDRGHFGASEEGNPAYAPVDLHQPAAAGRDPVITWMLVIRVARTTSNIICIR
jgi:hypothetical protein